MFPRAVKVISKGYLSAFRVKLLEQRAASSSVKELEAELNEEVASFPQSWSQTRGSCPRELPATELCREKPGPGRRFPVIACSERDTGVQIAT